MKAISRRPSGTTTDSTDVAATAEAPTATETGEAPETPAEPEPDPASPVPTATSAIRAKVIVRIDLEALLRGYPASGEVCEIAGYDPVAVSAVKDMDTGDPFLAAVVADGEQVAGVAHMGRRPNAAQQTALEWLYPTCAVEVCSVSVGLENDYRIDWAQTRFTVFDLSDRLCGHHNRLKTTKGWSLVDGRGKRAFVAPDDRRHPTSAGRRSRPPPQPVPA